MDNLPDGWVSTVLTEPTSLHDNMRKPLNANERAERKGAFPYYGANGQVDSIDDFMLEGEHVLLAEDGGHFEEPSKGVAYIADGKFWVNNHAHVLRGMGGMPNSFLKHQLNSINWIPYVGGSTRLKLTQTSMRSVPFLLPPLNEQKRIADKIDALFARSGRAKEALDALPALLNQYRQSILAAAFRGDLTKDWREKNRNDSTAAEALSTLREERSKQKQKYKKYNHKVVQSLQEIPKGWVWAKLPELGELARGKSKHRPRNDPRLFDGSYPFIQTGEVSNAGRLITSYKKTYSDFGLLQSRMWPEGTLCITIAANIAETSVLGLDACFPDSVVGLIADEKVTTADFVEYFIRTVKDDLEAFAPATAQKNINLGTLYEVHVPLPPLAEQKLLLHRLHSTFDRINTIENIYTDSMANISTLNQAILAKAFRGELVPQDPNDEPASELLKRIKSERAQMEKQQKNKKRVARKTTTRKNIKMIIAITDALKQANKPLSSQQLLEAAGYPKDVDTDQIEKFFIELRDALSAKKVFCKRDGEDDYFEYIG